MTTTVNTQILLKRGNTAVASTYIGPIGELVYDTDLHAVRVQDGLTPGGNLIPTASLTNTLSSNIAVLQSNVLTLQSDVAVLQNMVRPVPVSSIGNIGDIRGMTSVSPTGNVLYVCYDTYNGNTSIWSQTTLNNTSW